MKFCAINCIMSIFLSLLFPLSLLIGVLCELPSTFDRSFVFNIDRNVLTENFPNKTRKTSTEFYSLNNSTKCSRTNFIHDYSELYNIGLPFLCYNKI